MLGDRIKQLREENGYQAQFIAEKINVAKSTYSGYENNKSTPDYEILIKIADFFNVSIDYLLERTSKTEINYNPEKDIEKQIIEIIKELNDDRSDFLFKGERPDDITKEALLISLKNTLNLAEVIYKNNMRK